MSKYMQVNTTEFSRKHLTHAPPTTGNGCLELQYFAYKSLSPVKQKTKLVYSGKTSVTQYKSTSSVTG
jgi:hypothetical protein